MGETWREEQILKESLIGIIKNLKYWGLKIRNMSLKNICRENIKLLSNIMLIITNNSNDCKIYEYFLLHPNVTVTVTLLIYWVLKMRKTSK